MINFDWVFDVCVRACACACVLVSGYPNTQGHPEPMHLLWGVLRPPPNTHTHTHTCIHIRIHTHTHHTHTHTRTSTHTCTHAHTHRDVQSPCTCCGVCYEYPQSCSASLEGSAAAAAAAAAAALPVVVAALLQCLQREQRCCRPRTGWQPLCVSNAWVCKGV